MNVRRQAWRTVLSWGEQPSVWIIVSGIVLVVDYFSGPEIQFPILLVIPVSLAAWFGGLPWGLGLSIALSLARFAYSGLDHSLWPQEITYVNVAIRAIALAAMAFFANLAARRTREVKELRGLLPICSYCKRIRHDSGQWTPLDQFVREHSEADFSHTMCPECAHEHYPAHFPPPGV